MCQPTNDLRRSRVRFKRVFALMGLVLMTGCAPAVNPGTPSTALLFVINGRQASILVFSNLSTIDGNVAPAAVIEGAATDLDRPGDMTVDSNEALIVTDTFDASINIYENARTLNGNVPPSRKVVGAATQLVAPGGVAYDPVADELYVADIDIPAILVFAAVSTAAFDGDVAPARKISEPNTITANMGGLALTQDGDLIVGDQGFAFHALQNVASLDGPIDSADVFTFPRFGSIFDVFVDQGDRLYATGNFIQVWLNASNPFLPASLSVKSDATGIVVDASGTAYATNPFNDAIEIWQTMAARDPAQPVDRLIEGPATLLNGPSGVALLP